VVQPAVTHIPVALDTLGTFSFWSKIDAHPGLFASNLLDYLHFGTCIWHFLPQEVEAS
jgi:hypothetical protein